MRRLKHNGICKILPAGKLVLIIVIHLRLSNAHRARRASLATRASRQQHLAAISTYNGENKAGQKHRNEMRAGNIPTLQARKEWIREPVRTGEMKRMRRGNTECVPRKPSRRHDDIDNPPHRRHRRQQKSTGFIFIPYNHRGRQPHAKSEGKREARAE